ncbi:putative beta-lysine N-acetyltransferase [Clostridium tyrobutyricum]|uniref:putative beta-lysine N-acetyltransferase n=1 Tax=Clostridium tyrobutyricum TaxID=1519 RepID=UPI001C38CEE9|nr:putative beta-lysine N-acetyltransferase [Clostridium tyrobutyricum]MBV4422151.1 putative beta-lysine N-acetyltransferase [Clostridium tyrobutyricum]
MILTNYKSDNYYAKINQSKIYVDYVNSLAKIVDFHNISVQNIKRLVHFASRQHLGKIIYNCDAASFKNFIKAGFKLEGKIDSYFKGESAFCMSYFISKKRKLYNKHSMENLILIQSLNAESTFVPDTTLKYNIRYAEKRDAKQMSELFSKVFFECPSPLFDEKYLKDNMNKRILYKTAVYNGKIISAASAYLNEEDLNAELINCATHPNYRNKGVVSNIISSFESDLISMGYMGIYSLSRATCTSINFALSKNNYKFRGRLINNCNIYGEFEDMNIWVKDFNN